MEANMKGEILDLHLDYPDEDMGYPGSGVSMENVEKIAEAIAAVKDTVKVINLNGQDGLTEIPAVLGECLLLEEFDVSYTDIPEIPDFVFELPALRSLSFRGCFKLARFPDALYKAKKLEKLEFKLKEGVELSSELCSFSELRSLIIDADYCIKLPENMGSLKKLEDFRLSAEGKKDKSQKETISLPGSFSNHPSLKKIQLISHNFSLTNPLILDESTLDILSTCPALEVLELHGINLGDNHKSLAKLSGLKEIDIWHCFNEGNPFYSIAGLKKLEKLVIHGGELSINELPDIFDGLPALRDFCLAGSFVKAIPPSFYKLKKLEIVELRGGGIADIDEEIGNLKNLQKLILRDNMLKKLPESIFSLPNLAVLIIENNNFSKKEISYIKKNLKAKKIKLYANRQEKEQYIKKLRASDFDKLEKSEYLKICLDAVKEYAGAIQYVDKRITGNEYLELCEKANFMYGSEFEHVDPQQIREGKQNSKYFKLCKKAIQSAKYVEHVLQVTKDEYLNNEQYIQICLLAVLLHTGTWTVLQKIKHERLDRVDYEMICRAAIIKNPLTIGGMFEPTPDFCLFAVKLGAHLGCIPDELITREICLICAERGDIFSIDSVPQEFKDEVKSYYPAGYFKGVNEFSDDIPFD